MQQFVLFAAFVLRDAITPIVAFSYGAGSRRRINDGIRWGLIYTTVIMAAGIIIVEAAAQPLSVMFGLSGETARLFMGAARIATAAFIFAGVNVALQGVFQALGGGIESLVISVCRQLIFVLPPALLIANNAAENAAAAWQVWTVFPAAELLTAVIALFMLRGIRKRRLAGFSD